MTDADRMRSKASGRTLTNHDGTFQLLGYEVDDGYHLVVMVHDEHASVLLVDADLAIHGVVSASTVAKAKRLMLDQLKTKGETQ